MTMYSKYHLQFERAEADGGITAAKWVVSMGMWIEITLICGILGRGEVNCIVW